MVVTPPHQFRHLALFYRGRDEYLRQLCDFIQSSRARGHAVFAAVPGRQAEQLRRRLGAESAQVAVADMAELGRNPARIIPEVLAFAQSHPGQDVCCVGEPIWPGRTAEEIEEAVRHEALVNLAFRDRPVTFLCAYDGARLPRWVVADAASTHPSVVTGQREAVSAGYLSPPALPPRCDRALPPPPAHAEALGYRDDLRSVRNFYREQRRAGRSRPAAYLRSGNRRQRARRQHRAPRRRRCDSADLAHGARGHLPGR